MGEGPALCMCTPGKASPTTALTESQNIPEQVPSSTGSSANGGDGISSGRAPACAGDPSAASSPPPACTPQPSSVRLSGAAAEAPPPVEGKQKQRQQQQQPRQRAKEDEVDDSEVWNSNSTRPSGGGGGGGGRGGDTPAAASDRLGGVIERVAADDGEAESLALARRLLEEEAMASYSAAVDMFREGSAGGDGMGGVGPMAGVAAEDMAAMQALLEEDENSPDAFAMAEDESLDYDGMLELGSVIGDVRKDRWRLKCKGVINSLPRFRYAVDKSEMSTRPGEDTKCLVCQCDFVIGEELRRLPCDHTFHTECVDGWLEDNEECPTCRHSIDSNKPKES